MQPAHDNSGDILQAQEYVHHEYATQGQRFLNWLIDNILMRFGLSYLTGMAIGLILGLIAPEFLQDLCSKPKYRRIFFKSRLAVSFLSYHNSQLPAVLHNMRKALSRVYFRKNYNRHKSRQAGRSGTYFKKCIFEKPDTADPFRNFQWFFNADMARRLDGYYGDKSKVITPGQAATIFPFLQAAFLYEQYILPADLFQFCPRRNIYFRGVQSTIRKRMMQDTWPAIL